MKDVYKHDSQRQKWIRVLTKSFYWLIGILPQSCGIEKCAFDRTESRHRLSGFKRCLNLDPGLQAIGCVLHVFFRPGF